MTKEPTDCWVQSRLFVKQKTEVQRVAGIHHQLYGQALQTPSRVTSFYLYLRETQRQRMSKLIKIITWCVFSFRLEAFGEFSLIILAKMGCSFLSVENCAQASQLVDGDGGKHTGVVDTYRLWPAHTGCDWHIQVVIETPVFWFKNCAAPGECSSPSVEEL